MRSLLDEKGGSFIVPGIRQLEKLTVTATQLPLVVENCMEQFEDKLLLVATSHLQMLKVLNKKALAGLTVNDLPKDLLSLAVSAVKQAAGPQDMVTFSAVESAIKSEVEKFCQMLMQKSVNQVTRQGPLQAKNTSGNSQPGHVSSSLTSNERIQLGLKQVSPPCTPQAPLVAAQISSSAPCTVARTQVCPGLSSSEVRHKPPSVTTLVSSSKVRHKPPSVTTWVSSSSEVRHKPPSVTTWDSSSSEVHQGSDCQPTAKVRPANIYPPLISLKPPGVSAQISPSLAVCQFAEHQSCEPYSLLPSSKSFGEKREHLFGNLSQRHFSNTRYWVGMEVPGLDGISMQVPDFDHRSHLCNPPLREASIASHGFVSSEAEIWSSNCTVIKYHRDLSLFRPSHGVQSQIPPSTSPRTFLTAPASSTVQRCASGHHMQKIVELTTTEKHKLRELKKEMVDLITTDQHESRDLNEDPARIELSESRDVKGEIVDLAKVHLHESKELKEEFVDLDTTTQHESKELTEEVLNLDTTAQHESKEFKEEVVDLDTAAQHESKELKEEVVDLDTTAQHESEVLKEEVVDLYTTAQHESQELKEEFVDLDTTAQHESKELKEEVVDVDTTAQHEPKELKEEIGNSATLGVHEFIDLTAKILGGPTTDQKDSEVELVKIDELDIEALKQDTIQQDTIQQESRELKPEFVYLGITDQHESRELKQGIGELSTTHQHDAVELNKEIMNLDTIDEHEIKELKLETVTLVATDQQESSEMKSEIVYLDKTDQHGSRELKQEIGNLASVQYISGDLKQEISKTGPKGPKIEIDIEENLSFSWLTVSKDSGGSAVPWAAEYCSHPRRSNELCEVQLENIAHHPHWGHLVRKLWRQHILAGKLYLNPVFRILGLLDPDPLVRGTNPDHSIIEQK